ncbi:MAG: hypothetical protein IJP77_06305 [Bacteroidales bacterium]|nr:hypothetical protein [Bacteroidales bacterium]
MDRAEQFARTLYTPWSEDGMSRKDNTEVIEACIKGYEQAEKDIIDLIESRIGKILGDAQPTPILRYELQDLIKKIKEKE